MFNVIDNQGHIFNYTPGDGAANTEFLKEVDGAQEIRAAQDGVSMAMLKPGTRQEYYLFTIGNDSVVYYHHLDMSIEGPGGNDGVLLSINTPLDVQSSYLQGMALIEDHTAAETSVLYLRRVGATAVGSNTQELVAIRIRDGQFFPPVVLDSFESRLEASTSHEMAINHYGTQLAVGNDIDQVNDNDYEMRLYTLGWDHIYESGVDNLQVGIVNEASDARSFLSVDFSPQSDYLVMTDKLDGSSTYGQIYRWNVDNISSQQPQLIQGGIRRRARTIGRKFSGSNVDPSAITTVLLKAEVKSRDYDEYQNPDDGISITNDISLNLPGNVGINVQYMLPTTAHQPLRITKVNPDVYARVVGDKQYELTDHLGNVRMVFSDLKKPNVLPTTAGPTELNYATDILTITDYYPFGMQMPGRVYTSGGYRYGFQGQEKDDEIKGPGNSVNYKYRMHDPRLGRFFSVDPLFREYPHNGPYNFSENRVIDGVELEGLEVKLKNGQQGPFSLEYAEEINSQYESELENGAAANIILAASGTLLSIAQQRAELIQASRDGFTSGRLPGSRRLYNKARAGKLGAGARIGGMALVGFNILMTENDFSNGDISNAHRKKNHLQNAFGTLFPLLAVPIAAGDYLGEKHHDEIEDTFIEDGGVGKEIMSTMFESIGIPSSPPEKPETETIPEVEKETDTSSESGN